MTRSRTGAFGHVKNVPRARFARVASRQRLKRARDRFDFSVRAAAGPVSARAVGNPATRRLRVVSRREGSNKKIPEYRINKPNSTS